MKGEKEVSHNMGEFIIMTVMGFSFLLWVNATMFYIISFLKTVGALP